MRIGNKDWAYPVKDWKIILKFKQKERFWEDEFKSISHFSTYLTSSPHKANPIGYGIPDDKRTNFEAVSDVSLHFWYVDDFGKEERLDFKNVHEFANYLDSNPTLAKCLGYRKKSPLI